MTGPAHNPIKSSREDLLRRSSAASVFAGQLRKLDSSEGYVVSVTGPWGSGKTSFVNLMREELSKEPAFPTVDFNPWMFAGVDQLVNSFFREISAQLRVKGDRLSRIAQQVEDYGELLSPLAAIPGFGAWFDRTRKANKSWKDFRDSKRNSVEATRLRVSDALKALDTPIVVIIDDIDRLQTAEIRDVFKLVRLTGSFPKVIYVLAFDRTRVEQALVEDGAAGRSFLDKIVQLSIDVPGAPGPLLQAETFRSLEAIIEELTPPVEFDTNRWASVYDEVIAPLITNVRDIRRYVASVGPTLDALGSNIDTVDLLALEAVRVFMPDVHAEISSVRQWFTHIQRDQSSQTVQRERIDPALSALDDEYARSLVAAIFPAADACMGGYHYDSSDTAEWLRNRRLAHGEWLNLYFDRFASTALQSFTEAERALQLLPHRDEFEAYLRSLSPDRLREVLAALPLFEGRFPPNSAVAASLVLLEMIPEIKGAGGSNLAIPARIYVHRLVRRLIRDLEEPSLMQVAIGQIFSRLTSLSARWNLLWLIGKETGVGESAWSASFTQALKTRLSQDILQATPEELKAEWALLELLQAPAFFGVEHGPVADPANTELSGAILRRSLIGGGRSDLGVTAGGYGTRLDRQSLLNIYGSEESLRQAADSARALEAVDGELAAAIRLIDEGPLDD